MSEVTNEVVVEEVLEESVETALSADEVPTFVLGSLHDTDEDLKKEIETYLRSEAITYDCILLVSGQPNGVGLIRDEQGIKATLADTVPEHLKLALSTYLIGMVRSIETSGFVDSFKAGVSVPSGTVMDIFLPEEMKEETNINYPITVSFLPGMMFQTLSMVEGILSEELVAMNAEDGVSNPIVFTVEGKTITVVLVIDSESEHSLRLHVIADRDEFLADKLIPTWISVQEIIFNSLNQVFSVREDLREIYKSIIGGDEQQAEAAEETAE